jgi:hypothetical protein
MVACGGRNGSFDKLALIHLSRVSQSRISVESEPNKDCPCKPLALSAIHYVSSIGGVQSSKPPVSSDSMFLKICSIFSVSAHKFRPTG